MSPLYELKCIRCGMIFEVLVWKQTNIYDSKRCTHCGTDSEKHELVPSVTGKPIIK